MAEEESPGNGGSKGRQDCEGIGPPREGKSQLTSRVDSDVEWQRPDGSHSFLICLKKRRGWSLGGSGG